MNATVFPVFVSSTSFDLEPERLAVRDAIVRMRETQFVGMEYFGSRDDRTLAILGDRTQAITHAEQALKVFEQIESPHAKTVRAQLAKWRGGDRGGVRVYNRGALRGEFW